MLKAVASYGMRSFEKTILKATWNDDSPPKEQYLEYLIRYSSRPNRGDIASSIQSRISLRSSWKVEAEFACKHAI